MHMENSVCGGTILDEETILSAAHCLYDETGQKYNPTQVKVEVGFTVHINKTHPKKLQVKKYYLHPRYDQLTYDNDIAILKLKRPLNFNKAKVGPASLPYASFTPEENDQMGLLSGFGHTRIGALPNGLIGDKHLMHVTLPFVTNGYCQQKYNELETGRHITSRMLCAGYTEGGKNSCPGDSGYYLRPSMLLPAYHHKANS